jgi:hypothetical protein
MGGGREGGRRASPRLNSKSAEAEPKSKLEREKCREKKGPRTRTGSSQVVKGNESCRICSCSFVPSRQSSEEARSHPKTGPGKGADPCDRNAPEAYLEEPVSFIVRFPPCV